MKIYLPSTVLLFVLCHIIIVLAASSAAQEDSSYKSFILPNGELQDVRITRLLDVSLNELIEKAKSGEAQSQNDLGLYYLTSGNREDIEKASHWFELAIAQEHPGAMVNYASMIIRSLVPKHSNLSDALIFYQRASAIGVPDADYGIGMMYLYGLGDVKIECDVGMQYVKKAADRGLAAAQFELAGIYLGMNEACSSVKDVEEGISFLSKAARNNHVQACRYLGLAYLEGFGLQRDTVEATKWLYKAAQNGDVESQYNLGYYHSTGKDGFEHKIERSVYWYNKAAEQGDYRSMAKLGFLYYLGEDLPQDYSLAKHWFLKAKKAGYADADKMLEQLKLRGY